MSGKEVALSEYLPAEEIEIAPCVHEGNPTNPLRLLREGIRSCFKDQVTGPPGKKWRSDRPGKKRRGKKRGKKRRNKFSFGFREFFRLFSRGVPRTNTCGKRDFVPTTCTRYSPRLFCSETTHATCIRLYRAHSRRAFFGVARGPLSTACRRKSKKRILFFEYTSYLLAPVFVTQQEKYELL